MQVIINQHASALASALVSAKASALASALVSAKASKTGYSLILNFFYAFRMVNRSTLMVFFTSKGRKTTLAEPTTEPCKSKTS